MKKIFFILSICFLLIFSLLVTACFLFPPTEYHVVGLYSSITTDSNNKIHISHYDKENNNIRYTTNASGSWVTEIVSEVTDECFGTSIAIDSNGKIHISYHNRIDYENSELKYATNASGSWNVVDVDTTGDTGWYSSFVLDNNDKAHISYCDETNVDLKYATNASGSWTVTAIDTEGDVGSFSSIALDSNGKIHISYMDRGNVDLKYITNKSGSWVAENFDTCLGYYTSIAIDSNDNVHISECDYSEHGIWVDIELKYVTNQSGSWEIVKADTTEDVGRFTSIILDSDNKAYISYQGDNSEIRYATNASGSWVNETVDVSINTEDGANILGYTSIALDDNDKAHISYHRYISHYGEDFYDGELKYATNVSGSWVAEKID